MKSKFVLRVLAVMGILALSASVAQAGDGGKPTPLAGFFICYSINGDRTGHVVDVKSPVFGADQQSVRIGKGALACAWARLFTRGNLPTDTTPSPFPNEVDPSPTDLTRDQLKCYDVTVARKKSGHDRHDGQAVFAVNDSLYAGTLPLMENGNPGGGPGSTEPAVMIKLSDVKYICGPAVYFQ